MINRIVVEALNVGFLITTELHIGKNATDEPEVTQIAAGTVPEAVVHIREQLSIIGSKTP